MSNQGKNKKRDFMTPVLVIFLLVGLCLMLYPSVSNYWNSFTQSRAIASYAQDVDNLDAGQYDALLADAHAYNSAVAAKPNQWVMTDEDMAQYMATLNVGGSGIMAQIEIPSIQVNLPVYHGTADSVLQIAVGHIDSTSLPVGGKGTHAVLSGHRGLPCAKLFSDLDKLQVGDTFLIRVLGEVLTYEIDQILIVEPADVSSLVIDPEQDYVTLVTCTPYGVNTHRILVRGHRIETQEAAKQLVISGEASVIDKALVAPFLAAPVLLLLFLKELLWPKKKK